jgi:hypothetical protein
MNVFYVFYSQITNKMQLCDRIYYSTVYWRLNMFRAAYRSSSRALTVFAVSALHTHVMTGRSQVWVGTVILASHNNADDSSHGMGKYWEKQWPSGNLTHKMSPESHVLQHKQSMSEWVWIPYNYDNRTTVCHIMVEYIIWVDYTKWNICLWQISVLCYLSSNIRVIYDPWPNAQGGVLALQNQMYVVVLCYYHDW